MHLLLAVSDDNKKCGARSIMSGHTWVQKENDQLKSFNSELKSHLERNFPGPVAKILGFQCTGGSGMLPGQETRSHMPQPRVLMLQLKNPSYSNEDRRFCVWQLRPSTTK